MKKYGFACLYGINLIDEKNSVCVFAQKNGKSVVFSKKNKFQVAKGIPIIRGLLFLFYGLFLFFSNLTKNANIKDNKLTKRTKQSLNLSSNNIFLFLMLIIAFLISILVLGILPTRLSFYLTSLNFNMFLKRFVVAIIRFSIIYIILLVFRAINSFKAFYKLNGAVNCYINNSTNNQTIKNNDNHYYSLNFLNYLVCSFLLCSVILSMVGFTISTWYYPLLNLLFSLLIFALNYELISLLSTSKSKFLKNILRPIEFLTTSKPGITEIKLVQIGQQELIFMKNKKREYTNTLEKNDLITLSDAILEAKTILQDKNKYEKSDLQFALCEILNKSIAEVKMTNYLTNEQYKKFISVVEKRADGMPMTKIFSKAYFYGNELYITKDVLSPRQETEILVEETLKIVKPKFKILDLCTGSGAIAISIAKNCKNKVVASDISEKALTVARKNANELNASVVFLLSDLFHNIKRQKFDIIVSNPPYIKSGDLKSLEEEVVNHDPQIALDGGNSGLDFYKKIIEQAPKYLNKKGYLLFEIGINQSADIKNLLQKNFENIRIVKDYNRIDRVIIAQLK